MTGFIEERRANPRIEINGEMTYQTENSKEALRGRVENLSLGGARIWIEKELPAASQLHFRVESEVEELAVEFVATLLHTLLLHTLPCQKKSLYGYGCIIEKAKESTN